MTSDTALPVDLLRAEALEVAAALTEFSDIDEAEGGNPHVIATERRAADLQLAEAVKVLQPFAVHDDGITIAWRQVVKFDFPPRPRTWWWKLTSEERASVLAKALPPDTPPHTEGE